MQADKAKPTCVLLRRGVLSDIADAVLRTDHPSTNYGTAALLLAGQIPIEGERRTLLRADLSPIPAGSTITQATLELHSEGNTGALALLELHAVTTPWIESVATWDSFGSSFDPAAAATFSNGGAHFVGIVSVPLPPSLVQAWVAGSTPNEGLVLMGDGSTLVNSFFTSSEGGLAVDRPSLQICYLPAGSPSPCAGVTCAATDACHEAGVCDPATGQCSNPAKADGAACDDGDACTQTDACASGLCVGSNPTTCPASDACHGDGACDPASGQCAHPPKPDGTSCSDGDAGASGALCSNGVCITPDAGSPDAGVPDASAPDASAPDASAPDAGLIDASAPDAGLIDASAPDASAPNVTSSTGNDVLFSVHLPIPATGPRPLFDLRFDYRMNKTGGVAGQGWSFALASEVAGCAAPTDRGAEAPNGFCLDGTPLTAVGQSGSDALDYPLPSGGSIVAHVGRGSAARPERFELTARGEILTYEALKGAEDLPTPRWVLTDARFITGVRAHAGYGSSRSGDTLAYWPTSTTVWLPSGETATASFAYANAQPAAGANPWPVHTITVASTNDALPTWTYTFDYEARAGARSPAESLLKRVQRCPTHGACSWVRSFDYQGVCQ